MCARLFVCQAHTIPLDSETVWKGKQKPAWCWSKITESLVSLGQWTGGFPPSHLAVLSSLWLSGSLSVFSWELMSLPLAAAGPWHPETTTLTSRHYYTDIQTLPAAGPWYPDNATLPSRHCSQGCFVWLMSGQCQLQEHSLWSLLNQPCTRYLQWNCDGGYTPYFSYQ